VRVTPPAAVVPTEPEAPAVALAARRTAALIDGAPTGRVQAPRGTREDVLPAAPDTPGTPDAGGSAGWSRS
jgi:hypothetical protein